MMKFSKMVAGAAAAVLALAALPLSAVSAAEAVYAPGDVDKDGVITGHDSAMVSRYLYDEDYSLTEAQLALADMNGDGTVDQSDLEAIHAQEAYVLGDIMKSGEDHGTLYDAYYTMMFWSYNCVGVPVSVIDSEINGDGVSEDYADYILQGTLSFLDALKSGKPFNSVTSDYVLTVDRVSYNLMDVNADGKVTFYDAFNLMIADGRYSIEENYYGIDGRYDIIFTGFHFD